MRTKSVLSKIAALGAGLAMMGATLGGALAADLSQYPGLFLKDGKFNAAIVVGDQAAASDVVGSIDLAASLQFVAREEKTISLGGSSTVTATDGAAIDATGNHLNLAGATVVDTLLNVETSLKDDDLPVLLVDGTVRDDSTNDDYDYTQKIIPGGDSVKFGLPDDDVFGEVPRVYLDQGAGEAYHLEVDFDSAINLSALDDSEKIVIAGRTFTFDPDVAQTDSMAVLYASEKTETINVGDSKEVTLEDGTILSMELVGANSDAESATLKVNGRTYSVIAGDTITPSGTSVYINDVFTYNIPTPGAAVEFFVGSDKVEIQVGATYSDVEIDDNTVTGVSALIEDASNGLEEVSKINFKITPADFDEDQYKYLLLGEDFVDPFFGTFKMSFAGMTPELKDSAKSKISLTRSGDDYKLAFSNKDGEAYEFALYTGGSTLVYHADFAGATLNVTDDEIFIIDEGDIAKVYELRSVTEENSVLYANLRDLADNKDLKVRNDTVIGDSSYKITDLNNGATDWMELDTTTLLTFKTEFDGTLLISPPGTTTPEITFTEGSTNFEDLVTADLAVMTINVTEEDADNHDITITGLTVADTDERYITNDDGNDVEYGLTVFGTYWERELDQAGDYVDIYYPEQETRFHVFFMPTDATTSTTAGGDTLTYFEYNEIVKPAKLASEIADVTAQNLIVVGGPCANSVASALKGNPANCAEGFEDGKAIIELIANGNNVAVLVAGYSAEDTRRATNVLTKYGSYALTGTELEVTGTNMEDITVTVPTVEVETVEVETVDVE